MKYVVEGKWSRTGNVHLRFIVKRPKPIEEISCIVFGDGTSLDITVREMRPREKVEELKSYVELIDRAIMKNLSGVISVELLGK